MRQPGIEPGSTAWKAAMLTTIPLTLDIQWCCCRKWSNKSSLPNALSVNNIFTFYI